MTKVLERAGWMPVTRETRGEALRRRMLALQLDASKLARRTGKERNTITRALNGESSDLTLDQLEAWFDSEERKLGIASVDVAPAEEVGRGRKPATIRMEEGGTLVVEGPLDTPEDAELLKNLARDLMREWKSGPRAASD